MITSLIGETQQKMAGIGKCLLKRLAGSHTDSADNSIALKFKLLFMTVPKMKG